MQRPMPRPVNQAGDASARPAFTQMQRPPGVRPLMNLRPLFRPSQGQPMPANLTAQPRPSIRPGFVSSNQRPIQSHEMPGIQSPPNLGPQTQQPPQTSPIGDPLPNTVQSKSRRVYPGMQSNASLPNPTSITQVSQFQQQNATAAQFAQPSYGQNGKSGEYSQNPGFSQPQNPPMQPYPQQQQPIYSPNQPGYPQQPTQSANRPINQAQLAQQSGYSQQQITPTDQAGYPQHAQTPGFNQQSPNQAGYSQPLMNANGGYAGLNGVQAGFQGMGLTGGVQVNSLFNISPHHLTSWLIMFQ
jgi:hypothetical protein